MVPAILADQGILAGPVHRVDQVILKDRLHRGEVAAPWASNRRDRANPADPWAWNRGDPEVPTPLATAR